MHGAEGTSQDFANLLAIAMGDLVARVQFEDIAGGVVAGDGAASLDRNTRVSSNGEVERDNGMRRTKRAVEITVAFLNDHGLGRQTGLKLTECAVRRQQRR